MNALMSRFRRLALREVGSVPIGYALLLGALGLFGVFLIWWMYLR